MALQTPAFIGWTQPLAAGVASALIKAAAQPDNTLPLDLGSHRVIVPSNFASRLIQEELAVQCPQGVLLPIFQTPTKFLNWGDSFANAATSSDALLAWIEVLCSTDRQDFKNLFPHTSKGIFTFEEAQRFAQTLYQLRDELGGSARGLDFAGIAQLETNQESARWQDLAQLEKAYREALKKRGLRDHNDLRTELALGDGYPEGVTHIWLAGLIDPQPLFISALERLQSRFQIQAIVGADATEANNFDTWGRPLPKAWHDRKSDWKDFDQSIHVVSNPTEALKKLRTVLGETKPTDGVHAVCACDREVDAPKIAALIHSMGTDAVNPLGTSHGDHLLHHSLRVWSRCLGTQEPEFEEIRPAFQIPCILEAITGGTTPYAYTTVHEQLDCLDGEMIRGPISVLIEEIQVLPNLSKRLDSLVPHLIALKNLRDEQRKLPWQAALIAILQKFVGSKKLRESNPDDAYTIEVIQSLIQAAAEIAQAQSESELQLTHQQLFGLVLDATASQRYQRSDAKEAVNLPGWVEAPWDPVPHLVLFGFNDQVIPQSIHAHPFLPAPLRDAAGLTTNAQTFAAAAFTFEQLWRRRAAHGWLDVIVPQTDADANPLRPSRLLFQTTDETLVQRVKILFNEAPDNEAQPYWQIPDQHKFVPLAKAEDAKKIKDKISPSAIRAYLVDPAEFWLKRALKMNEVGFNFIELAPYAFGNLIHGTLERFGKANLGKALSNRTEIEKQFQAFLDEYIQDTFGKSVPPSVRLQKEVARARLLAFAEQQAKLYNDGWVIQSVEDAFEIPKEVKGMMINGKCDRIDQNLNTGKWRIFDYKTSGKAKKPVLTHTTKGAVNQAFCSEVPKRNRSGEPTGDSKLIRWTDLQLPIYHLAATSQCLKSGLVIPKDQKLDIGYINLPPESSSTLVSPWNHYHEDYQVEAELQMKAVIDRILQGGTDAFQPSEGGSKNPLLKSLHGRPMKSYLNIEQLGGIRS